MNSIARATTVLALTLTVLLFAEPAAAATDVSCGQEINSAGVYTFSSDLTCTEPIRISTTGVTLDLRGHTLSGGGVALAGIIVWTYLDAPTDPVVVTNGTIRGFRNPFGGGVFVQSSGVALRHLTIIDNEIGVNLYSRSSGCCFVRVESNVIAGNGIGVQASPGTAPEVVNNRIVHNGSGIGAFETAGGYFRSNFVGYNTYTGIAVKDAAPIMGNLLIHNGGSGVSLTGQQPETWVVTDNVALGNGAYGIWAEFPPGHSGGNRAAGNGSTPQCWNVVCSPQ